MLLDGDAVVAGFADDEQRPGSWALTFFTTTQARDAAARVLRDHDIGLVGSTMRFGFPIVDERGADALLSFSGPMRLAGNDISHQWALADERSGPVICLDGPGSALTISW